MSRAGRKGQAIRDARNAIDHSRPDLSVTRERAILFGANLASAESTYEKPLAELARLADTAGADVRGAYSQNLARRHAATLVGKGFVESLGAHAEEAGASILICDNDLSPFEGIIPCGIEGYGVTSLSLELARDVGIEEAKVEVRASFQQVLGIELEHTSLEEMAF